MFETKKKPKNPRMKIEALFEAYNLERTTKWQVSWKNPAFSNTADGNLPFMPLFLR